MNDATKRHWLLSCAVVAALAAACGKQTVGFEDTSADAGTPPPVLNDGASDDAAIAEDAGVGIFGDLDGSGAGETSTALEGCRIATIGSAASDVTLFKNWLNQGGQAAGELGDAVITTALLKPYRMLVVLNVDVGHSYSQAEVDVLKAWVQEGGGLMSLAGYGFGSEPNVNALLAPFGIQLGSTGILYEPNGLPTISQWTHPNPITNGVSDLGFNNGLTVGGSGTALAGQTDNGTYYNVLMAMQVGQGHVVAWGDEWISRDTLWAQHPEFQIQTFWQNIVDWFDPNSGCKVPDPPK
jgi:hypothetical protein